MTDEQLYFLGNSYQVVSYLLRLTQVVGFVFAVMLAKNNSNKPFKGLALFLGSEFILWLVNHILLYDAPQEGITEFVYYNTLSAIFRILVLNYFFTYTLKFSRNTRWLVTLFAVFTVFLNIIDSINRGQETILEYVVYSKYVNDLFVVCTSLVYVIHALRSVVFSKMKFVPISLVFFSYFSIKLIYTMSSTFMFNQALKNNLVLIVMLSQIIFDLVFYCIVTFFVINQFFSVRKTTS